MILRKTRITDKNELADIWKNTFDDKDEFISLYFDTRFFPEFGICAEDNGKIISVCHIYPCRINIRNNAFNCGLLNGVATLPEYRRKGIMRCCIKMLHEELFGYGIPVVINTPVDPHIYESFSYTVVNDKITINRYGKGDINKKARVYDITADTVPLISKMYNICSKNISGMLIRNTEHIMMRCADWQTDASKVLVIDGIGYAVYSINEKSIDCQELLAVSDNGYRDIINALYYIAENRSVNACIPAFCDIEGNVSAKSMACILDPKAVFNGLGLDTDFTINITDSFNKSANCSLSSDNVKNDRSINISNRNFTSWVFGYKNLTETNAEFDDSMLQLINNGKISKINCYNTDEY